MQKFLELLDFKGEAEVGDYQRLEFRVHLGVDEEGGGFVGGKMGKLEFWDEDNFVWATVVFAVFGVVVEIVGA